MKRIALFLMIALSLGVKVRADEGMWIPMLLGVNYEDMKNMGLKLTSEQIYSINNSSLKDAIIQFGRGCTGEVVSDQGLVLTNHHCGYGQIQAHSSVEHDYLTDGFWAMSMQEELSNPGLTARFLIRIEDVTPQALQGVTSGMSEDDRNKMIGENNKTIEKKAMEGTHYEASVRNFYGGNEFYLFVFEVFKDVRLVGAPPSSIGNFGGDTDNWMWPRHTGDFSMFRIYSGPDGKPAEYSKDNIPLKPKHFLPISVAGVKKDDFAMIMGYPGGTDRYLTSYGVELAIDISNPTVVKIRTEILDIYDADMDADPAVRIKYASKHARISNYWKYYIGQTKGLKRNKVFEEKQVIESDFRAWASKDPSLNSKYGNVLVEIEKAYGTIDDNTKPSIYFREGISRGTEILSFANRFHELGMLLISKEKDQAAIDKAVKNLEAASSQYFKDYNLPTDKKLLAAMMKMYYEDVASEQQPQYLKDIAKKYKGDFSAYADYVFEKSIFAKQEKVTDLLKDPSVKAIQNDPAYVAYRSFFTLNQEWSKKAEEANKILSKSNRLFIAGLREMYPDRKFYPNANSTMRFTYGKVQDYYPGDAMHYDYFTTLDGVMEKEDPNNKDFVVPDRLKELYKSKDYGPYGKNGTLNTCFLTNHDITGGNSGSPVMNANGELIGIAFDGNWEAMSGDIAFEPALQRTINVDIRYVMFIIDKYAGAKNLIEEMKIVR